MMMLMLSRSSFSEIQTVVTNMTGYDNKRLDGTNKKKTVQYCCTYKRVHRSSSTSMYPRKRCATRRSVRRYIHTYIPYHLQQRNNELMKFIRAKRVNSTVMLYVYTRTPPQQYQYVPKETVRHHAYLWGGIYIRISRITCSNEIMNWWIFFERSEFLIATSQIQNLGLRLI